MSTFEYVNGSNEKYPYDQFTAESIALCFDGKYRVVYVRKKMKNGGMFWDVVTTAVTQNGGKKYLKGFAQDSNFLAEDIKSFLEGRSWEKGGKSEEREQLPF